MVSGEEWRCWPFDMYCNSGHGDGFAFNLELADWKPVSSLLVQRGSAQVAISSCYRVRNAKGNASLCLLQMMHEWAKETCWSVLAQLGGGTSPLACSGASLMPCIQLLTPTRLEKFEQNQRRLLSALTKHGTEKGNLRSFCTQTSLSASTCCSLKSLQPLTAWLQMAYGQPKRESFSWSRRPWHAINALIFLWACTKALNAITESQNHRITE